MIDWSAVPSEALSRLKYVVWEIAVEYDRDLLGTVDLFERSEAAVERCRGLFTYLYEINPAAFSWLIAVQMSPLDASEDRLPPAVGAVMEDLAEALPEVTSWTVSVDVRASANYTPEDALMEGYKDLFRHVGNVIAPLAGQPFGERPWVDCLLATDALTLGMWHAQLQRPRSAESSLFSAGIWLPSRVAAEAEALLGKDPPFVPMLALPVPEAPVYSATLTTPGYGRWLDRADATDDGPPAGTARIEEAAAARYTWVAENPVALAHALARDLRLGEGPLDEETRRARRSQRFGPFLVFPLATVPRKSTDEWRANGKPQKEGRVRFLLTLGPKLDRIVDALADGPADDLAGWTTIVTTDLYAVLRDLAAFIAEDLDSGLHLDWFDEPPPGWNIVNRIHRAAVAEPVARGALTYLVHEYLTFLGTVDHGRWTQDQFDKGLPAAVRYVASRSPWLGWLTKCRAAEEKLSVDRLARACDRPVRTVNAWLLGEALPREDEDVLAIAEGLGVLFSGFGLDKTPVEEALRTHLAPTLPGESVGLSALLDGLPFLDRPEG